MKLINYRNRSPFFSIFSAARTMERELLEDLSDCGLTIVEALCLIALYTDNSEEIFLKDISDTFGFSKSQVSQAISKLESDGHVRRAIHGKDRRRYRFTLSTSGRRMFGRLVGKFEKIDNRIEARLPVPERKRLEKLLDQLG